MSDKQSELEAVNALLIKQRDDAVTLLIAERALTAKLQAERTKSGKRGKR